MKTKNKLLSYVDKNMPSLLADLQKLINQPSISATNEGIDKCATLVSNMLKKSGIQSEILRLGKNIPPVVYGEVKSKKNPNKTLLFYNHYDVQPVEPIEEWEYPPFSGKIIGNKIFGRGASDDKGELITRIKAVESYLQEYNDVPCNIKFCIEGEEENGSENIEKYLKKFKKKFSCDGVIWEFGYIDTKNRPIVGLGMKGLLYVELSVKESIRAAHSSFATIIKNPAWRLIDALKTAGNGTWFRVVERVGIDHLTRERQIVRTTREAYQEEKKLAPLLFAGIILEGGIIGYDTNIETGGRGARYLGIGAQQAYRRDIVVVHLRAVSVLTGEILLNVQTSKTILSVAEGFDVFRFVEMDTQLVEVEDGMTENESVTRSVRSAIEAAVYEFCLLYTSPSPRDQRGSRMPSSA